MAPKTRSDMDTEVKIRLSSDDKKAFEEAASQLRLGGVSAFLRQAGHEKIRNSGLVVAKSREHALERQQRVAGQISMLRSWMREEPVLVDVGEQAIAVLENLARPGPEKRGKGGGR